MKVESHSLSFSLTMAFSSNPVLYTTDLTMPYNLYWVTDYQNIILSDCICENRPSPIVKKLLKDNTENKGQMYAYVFLYVYKKCFFFPSSKWQAKEAIIGIV